MLWLFGKDKKRYQELLKQEEQRKDAEIMKNLRRKAAEANCEFIGKYCAIRDASCVDSCIHFSKGYVQEPWGHKDSIVYIEPCVVQPSCKLWR